MLEILQLAANVQAPNITDWLLVALTAGSMVVSGLLGWLAYRNGQRASNIANEAARRDFEQRETMNRMHKDELDRAARTRRHAYGREVASYAVAKIGHVAAGTAQGSNIVEPTWRELNLAAASTDEETADALLSYTVNAITEFKGGTQSQAEATAVLDEVLKRISAWAEDPHAMSL